MNPILIGLDLGTTLCKCVACTKDGVPLASSSRIIPTDRTIANGAEQDPRDWTNAIVAVMGETAEQLGDDRRNILSMSVSAHGPGAVLTDKSGEPLIPCAIWQDNRSAADGYELFQLIGYDWVGHGLPHTGMAAKLKWLSRTQPQVMAKARHIHGIKGYLLYFLTGKKVTEPSSGLDWSPDLLKICGIDAEQMDEIVPSTACVGALLPGIARATGFPEHTVVVAGLNDGAAAMLGSGTTDVGKGVVSVSTNGIARMVVEEKLPGRFLYDHSMFCWPYVDGKYVTGGITKSAGDTVQWFIDIAYRDLPEEQRLLRFNEEAEQSAPGARGVRFFPWLLGRGSPAATDTPAGCFMGLARHHTRGDCARAIFEGVAFALREIGQQFRDMGYKWDDIRLTGGGMKSTLWRSIVCNTLGIEGHRVKSDSLLGVTMLAGVGGGVYPSVEAACAQCVNIIDDPQVLDDRLISIYEQAYQDYIRAKQPLADYLTSLGGDR